MPTFTTQKEKQMKAFKALLGVELKLSFRDMNMPLFAIIMPVVITAIIGMLYVGQPAFEGAPYSFVDQSVPAIVTVGICAGGAMGLPIVVSYYRQRGVLKRLFVTPINASTILIAQVAMYGIYAVVSSVLVLIVATVFFGYTFSGSALGFIGSYLLVATAMFSIGMAVGGLARDEKVASIAGSALYFPMLLLSGTTVPYEILPTPVQYVADVLPLTQGIKLLKATVLDLPLDGTIVAVVVLVAWSVVCISLALRYFKWE